MQQISSWVYFGDLSFKTSKQNKSKGYVRYIFANLFGKSKGEHL